ncbi:MAG: PGPGW domain-containing protein, partial [Thermodesulfovibrionales bacterium]|nr:PGPGW domain-containing protein [Thermodesulfovibrionales bacterium]
MKGQKRRGAIKKKIGRGETYRTRINAFFLKSINQAKRLIIAIIGFTVLLIGLAMIVLPGPAFIVIPVGLGILALEFAWARRLLK